MYFAQSFAPEISRVSPYLTLVTRVFAGVQGSKVKTSSVTAYYAPQFQVYSRPHFVTHGDSPFYVGRDFSKLHFKIQTRLNLPTRSRHCVHICSMVIRILATARLCTFVDASLRTFYGDFRPMSALAVRKVILFYMVFCFCASLVT